MVGGKCHLQRKGLGEKKMRAKLIGSLGRTRGPLHQGNGKKNRQTSRPRQNRGKRHQIETKGKKRETRGGGGEGETKLVGLIKHTLRKALGLPSFRQVKKELQERKKKFKGMPS